MSTANRRPVPSASTPDGARRAALLEAGFGVFARFGFRKTSMDEVARAAQISRQGLYLHFANKDELFRAVVNHICTTSLDSASRVLASEAPLAERLVGAFDEWVGRHVGRFSADAADLAAAAEGVAGTTFAEHEALFAEVVATALRDAGLMPFFKPLGLTARQLADNLAATARGLKHSCTSRDEFKRAFAIAARVTCAPLAKTTG